MIEGHFAPEVKVLIEEGRVGVRVYGWVRARDLGWFRVRVRVRGGFKDERQGQKDKGEAKTKTRARQAPNPYPKPKS